MNQTPKPAPKIPATKVPPPRVAQDEDEKCERVTPVPDSSRIPHVSHPPWNKLQ